MPFVRIDPDKGRSTEIRRSIGEIVYKAMVEVINVPANDKFQIITEHAVYEFNFASSYLGVSYTPGIRRLQPFRYLHSCSGCFRLERLPGGICTHWKAPPFHGARVERTWRVDIAKTPMLTL